MGIYRVELERKCTVLVRADGDDEAKKTAAAVEALFDFWAEDTPVVASAERVAKEELPPDAEVFYDDGNAGAYVVVADIPDEPEQPIPGQEAFALEAE